MRCDKAKEHPKAQEWFQADCDERGNDQNQDAYQQHASEPDRVMSQVHHENASFLRLNGRPGSSTP